MPLSKLNLNIICSISSFFIFPRCCKHCLSSTAVSLSIYRMYIQVFSTSKTQQRGLCSSSLHHVFGVCSFLSVSVTSRRLNHKFLKWWKNNNEDFLRVTCLQWTKDDVCVFVFFPNPIIKVRTSAKPKLTRSCSDCYCIPFMFVLLYAHNVCLLLNEWRQEMRTAVDCTSNSLVSVMWWFFIMWLLIKAEGTFSNLKQVFILQWRPVLGETCYKVG